MTLSTEGRARLAEMAVWLSEPTKLVLAETVAVEHGSDLKAALAYIDELEGDRKTTIERIGAALSWIEHPFVDENTPPGEFQKRAQFMATDLERLVSALQTRGG